MTTIGICYLLTGPAHAARLIVSLYTLRRFYSGNVVVFTTKDESKRIGEFCAQDHRLRVVHRTMTEVPIAKNSSFVTKIALLLDPPFDITAYLDCDTLISGPIDELFAVTNAEEFVATRFGNWVTTGTIVRRRIERWRTVASERFDTPKLVDSAIRTSRPSVNGGVCAARRGASILQPWFDLAMDGRDTFICDEVALHLLLHHHPHRLLDARFNNSPVYGGEHDIRIWHFHGDRHVRQDGVARWLPAMQAAYRDNIAQIANWAPGADKGLRQLMSNGCHNTFLKAWNAAK